jgi:predicted 3-demethylubiquinone-9 3-methyltransferase (glyoxalase superfamily)
MQKVTPFLWFDTEAEQAAEFYTSVIPGSKVKNVTRYDSPGDGVEGTVMTVSFELGGQEFTALNGGPVHAGFTESVSFVVDCESQDEVDEYWSKLTEGGEEGPCGWLKDKYGLSWQIVPRRLIELVSDSDKEKAKRAREAMLQMKKIDIEALEEAAEGSARV